MCGDSNGCDMSNGNPPNGCTYVNNQCINAAAAGSESTTDCSNTCSMCTDSNGCGMSNGNPPNGCFYNNMMSRCENKVNSGSGGAGGCFAAADCNPGKYCDFTTSTCKQKKTDYSNCNNDYECAANSCDNNICGNSGGEAAGSESTGNCYMLEANLSQAVATVIMIQQCQAPIVLVIWIVMIRRNIVMVLRA